MPTAGNGPCQTEIVLLYSFDSCKLFFDCTWQLSPDKFYWRSCRCKQYPQMLCSPLPLVASDSRSGGLWGCRTRVLGQINSASKPGIAGAGNRSVFAQSGAGALSKGPEYCCNRKNNSNIFPFLSFPVVPFVDLANKLSGQNGCILYTEAFCIVTPHSRLKVLLTV